MLDIKYLRYICDDKNIIMTKHAKLRLYERNIAFDEIKNAILNGEIIKQYEDDKPFPSCLILGKTSLHKHVHVVVSTDSGCLYIITAYYPNRTE